MNSLYQLEIPKRSVHCLHKGEHFIPGMEVYSVLRENDEHRLARNDYCGACWLELHNIEFIQKSRGYWKSKMEPRKHTPESSRTARALELLKEMLACSESQSGEIFVLCLFLARARQLALRQEFQQDGAAYQLYEIVRHEEFVTIKTVPLSHIQIEVIQTSLAQKLHHTSSTVLAD